MGRTPPAACRRIAGPTFNVGNGLSRRRTRTTNTLTYTLGGTDAGSFEIVETSGQLQTKSGVNYDREAKASPTR